MTREEEYDAITARLRAEFEATLADVIAQRDAWQKQHAGTLAVLEKTRLDLEATKTLYRNARQQIRDLEEDLADLEARR